MTSEKEIIEEINIGIDYANPNRVWKAIGDLIELEKQKERQEILKKIEELIDREENKFCTLDKDETDCLSCYVCEVLEELKKELEK